MNNFYKLPLLLLLCALVACGDDEEAPSPVKTTAPPDTVNPTILFLSPENNKAHLVIDMVKIHVKLTDNVSIGGIQGHLRDAAGKTRLVIEPITYSDVFRVVEYGNVFFPRDLEPGTYTLVLEVKDRQNNMAKDSVLFRIHAPNLNRAEFAKAFEENSFFYNIDWGWFGFDFTHGVQFIENEFDYAMFFMLTMDSHIKKEEWEKFMLDFRFENQTWATWDEDKNDRLEFEEFQKGIARLSLFKQWDLNKDQLVKADEFVTGIFDKWDQNQDRVLTRAEYQEKFYTYLTLY